MSIVKKAGDRGKTDLFAGRPVSKDNIRIEICGSLDELCSFLGLARSLVRNRKTTGILEGIQRDLFTIGSEVATEARHLGKLKVRIGKTHIRRLEEHIGRMEHKRSRNECCFYLPGGSISAAILDVARTVARRVERRVVTFDRRGSLRNPEVLVYLNRLSDLLFILAQRLEKRPKKHVSDKT